MTDEELERILLAELRVQDILSEIEEIAPNLDVRAKWNLMKLFVLRGQAAYDEGWEESIEGVSSLEWAELARSIKKLDSKIQL